jgi:hypothetical protein
VEDTTIVAVRRIFFCSKSVPIVESAFHRAQIGLASRALTIGVARHVSEGWQQERGAICHLRHKLDADARLLVR